MLQRQTTKLSIMNKSILKKALLFTALVLWPSAASAFSLDDVIRYHPVVWSLRTTANTIVNEGVIDPALKKTRTEIETLFDNKINPMLDRVDYIINHNITNAADQAMELLQKSESILRKVIHEVDEILKSRIAQVDTALEGRIGQINTALEGRIGQINTALERRIQQLDEVLAKRIAEAFQEFNAEASKLIDRTNEMLSGLVGDVACIFAPNRAGFQVSVPFLPSHNEARVWFPSNSYCWRNFLITNEEPVSRVFSGWQYYQGVICEQEQVINGIHLDDPHGMGRLIEGYSKLYVLAQKAICEIKLPETQRLLISRQAEWARIVEFYRSLSRAQ